MADYSYVEVMNRAREILDSLGRKEAFCQGVYCDSCPFQKEFCEEADKLENPEGFADFVMNYDITDWSKVKVDTPIYVTREYHKTWCPRYFAKYENGKVYAWDNGKASFTANGECSSWDKAKLVEDKECL